MSSKKTARWAFAIAILVFAAQYPIARAWGEPYPGLFLPSFGTVPQRGSAFVTNDYRAFLIAADGTETQRPAADLLPRTAVLASSVIKKTFFDAKTLESPETAQWLEGRVRALEPDADVVGVRVEMWEVDYDLDDDDAPPVERKENESTFLFEGAAE